ncbi:MAG: UDP-3-O-(3-hydroxymyristoyl)glucosamine N-acyltransferase, partial [Bacteroidota bacterium]
MIFKNCEEITKIVDGRPVGSNEGPVISLSPIDKAKEGSLSFISDEKYIKFLSESKPTCLIVKEGLDIQPDTGQLFIFTDDPYREFLKILKYVAGRREFTPGIHPKAVVEDSAIIAESAYIGPGCVIGKNARIGEKTRIGANTVIYDNVIIGSGTDLHANVTCYQDSEIGNGCVIHSGAVIGADGFGFYEDKSAGAYEKIPQIGNVIIEDDVEIGANTTIDRAMMGST